LFQRRLYAAWLIWNYSLQLILSPVTRAAAGDRINVVKTISRVASPLRPTFPDGSAGLGHPMTQHEMVDGRRRDKTARWLASE
jgi:hypothetical protein